jgi:TonB family protein
MMKRRDLASFGVSITMHVALVAALVLLVSVAPVEDARRAMVGLRVFSKPATGANVQGAPNAGHVSPADGRVEADAGRPEAVREGTQVRRAPEPATTPQADPAEPGSGDLQTAAAAAGSTEVKPATGAADGAADEDAGAGDGPGSGPGAGAGAGVGGTGDPVSIGASGVGWQATGGLAGGNSGARTSTVGGDGTGSYALMVRRALEMRGSYPGTARRLGLEGQLKMLVSIGPDGQVSDRRIHSSSGFRELDDAALASADRLKGLPPPPGGRAVDILVPIRFSMRRM